MRLGTKLPLMFIVFIISGYAFAMSDALKTRYRTQIEPLLVESCKDCHTTANQGQSVYGNIPLIGDAIDEQVQGHITEGLKYFEFVEGNTEFKATKAPVTQKAILLRIKGSMQSNNMPPTSYLLTHPTAGLSAAERQQVISFVDAAVAEIEAENGTQQPVLPQNDPIGEQVMSLFNASCAQCHGGNAAAGGLDEIDNLAHLISDGYVVPGNAEGSILFQSVASGDMPKNNDPLTQAQLDLIKEWINNNAATTISPSNEGSTASTGGSNAGGTNSNQ